MKLKNNSKPIRCLLLAAGLGTRLRPITYNIPKCLVKINGRTIIEWWLEHLESIDCESVIINTHYYSEKVSELLNGCNNYSVKIVEKYEKELLGTAGTLLANAKFFSGKIGIIIHADNATDTNLANLIKAHHNRPKHCLMTMMTFTTNTPESCGIVEIDSEGVVQRMHEKVKSPPGNRANGAIYVFEEELLEIIKESNEGFKDISTQVLPMVMGRIYTYHTRRNFIDIGTPESLSKARQIWTTSDTPTL